MTKAKRSKPMTAKEKKWRAELRTDMRAKGALPPVKKPLNRKKFIQEARDEFNEAQLGFAGYGYMGQAISYVMGSYKPTLEDVGVAKMLKCTCEIARFHEELKARGRAEYKVRELYERLKPILNA